MIEKSTLKFLEQLAQNNNSTWFHEHKAIYDQAKLNFESVVVELIDAIGSFEDLGVISPRECMFRINRDVRFSHDKSPYKTNLGAAIAKGGKKALHYSLYYFHVQPGKSLIAGGLYNPDSQTLYKMRQGIGENFKEFKKIIENKDLKSFFGDLQGEKLKRAPQGFDPAHPGIEFLKMKSFIIRHPFTDQEVMDEKFISKNTKNFKTMKPFLDFISKVVMT